MIFDNRQTIFSYYVFFFLNIYTKNACRAFKIKGFEVLIKDYQIIKCTDTSTILTNIQRQIHLMFLEMMLEHVRKLFPLTHDLMTTKVTSYREYRIEYLSCQNKIKKPISRQELPRRSANKNLILHVVHSTYFRQSYKYLHYKQNRTKCQGVTI